MMRHAPHSSFTEATPFVTPPEAGRRSAAAAIATRILWWLGLPARVMAIRRDMTLLAGMSRSELADIGLCRQDLCDAAALPLGETPGALLTGRAAERRRAANRRSR